MSHWPLPGLYSHKLFSCNLVVHIAHHIATLISPLTNKLIKAVMSKFNKSQILMLSILAALLFVTPLLSSSLRPKYNYFIINLLILAVGAEAGLLPRLSKPLEDKKHAVRVTLKPVITSPAQASSPEAKVTLASGNSSVSEKIVSTVEVNKVTKCPSIPSLFFTGSGETEAEELIEDDEEREEVGGLPGQELYKKAETFIGNFYDQLKMQREDSWKRIHGLSHKAFLSKYILLLLPTSMSFSLI